jgi:hypothetical protein
MFVCAHRRQRPRQRNAENRPRQPGGYCMPPPMSISRFQEPNILAR